MTGRCLLVVVGCLLVPLSARGDEAKRLDGERLAKITKAMAEATAKLSDLQVMATLDTDRSMGLEAKKAGLVVIPDAKLTPEALAKIDKEIVPLGMLYFHKVTPVVAGTPVPSENHRNLEITVGDKSATATILPLAAARVAGRLVLLAYTNKKEPTLVTELVDAEESKSCPLELEARSAGEGRATLTISVLSKYRAVITLAGQE